MAPLIVGANPDLVSSDDTVYALEAAMMGVPASRAVFSSVTAGVSHHKQPGHIGIAQLTGDRAKPYARRYRLVLGTAAQSPTQASEAWWWELALYVPKSGSLAPAVPADQTAALLQATKLSSHRGIVRGFSQMALMRHLWIDALRSRDPQLTVLGGQHEWNPEWDRLFQPAPVAAT